MIEFICGRSGRGKTQYIFDAIKATLKQRKNRPIYLIVPDQMSFQTEFELLQQVPNGAMMQVEVLGISRFLTQMIAYLSPKEYTVFDTLAQKMLMQQTALTQKKQLDFYQQAVEKSEFIDYLHQFSRQLKGTGMELDEVLQIEALQQHPLLLQKLKETHQIFTAYQAQVSPMMFDLADKMHYYLTLLDNPEYYEKLQAIDVYIDGYYTFNNLETAVIAQTLNHVGNGMLSFCMNYQNEKQSYSIFSLIHKQFAMFSRAVQVDKITQVDSDKHRFSHAPVLDFLEKHYETPQTMNIAEKQKCFGITIYKTIEEEIMQIATMIRSKIINENIRAKEIAIYLPEKELYTPLIEKYFKLYEIPYYLDLKTSMLIHPVMNWLFTLLHIIKQNWQIDDILNLLHNQFFRNMQGITDADYHLFVDFISQISYPYKKNWNQDKFWRYYNNPEKFADSYDETKTQIICAVRDKIITQIKNFETILNVKQTTTETVLAQLFAYIQKQNIYAYTMAMLSHKEHAKYVSHLTEEQYQEMVWKQLIFIFEQAHLAIGEQKYHKQSLIQALLLGLENAEFTSVPNGFDAVMIGDFARTKFQTLHQENGIQMGVQYVYIVGVNDRFVPHEEPTTNLLSNEELAIIQNNHFLQDILLQDEAIHYQLFHFYTLVTSAAKEVHISYYRYGGVYLEEEMLPSPVLKSFMQEGFDLPVNYFHADVNQQVSLFTETVAKHQLTTHYIKQRKEHTLLLQIVEALDANFVAYLDEAYHFKNESMFQQKLLLPEQLSLTQLETYNRCPYQYFLKYILRVNEPYKDKIQTVHTGNLLHGTYELLATIAQEQKIRLSDIQHPEIIIKQYFADNFIQLEQHPLFNLITNRYVYQKTEMVAQDSLGFLMKNEELSQFIPQFIEYKLPKFPIHVADVTRYLIGKLDRIDFDMTNQYFRIIDYKSSKRTIDFNKLIYGTQLQLPLYSYLAQQAFSQTLAGSMYVPMVDQDILIDTAMTDTDITKQLQKLYQATGLFLNDKESLVKFDQNILTEEKSIVIPYESKKDGTANQHSMVLEAAELQAVEDFALQKAKDTILHIHQQSFPVTPIREEYDYQTTPCKYCPFRSICQFDQKINCYNDKQKEIKEQSFSKKKEKFLTIIQEGESSNE